MSDKERNEKAAKDFEESKRKGLFDDALTKIAMRSPLVNANTTHAQVLEIIRTTVNPRMARKFKDRLG